MSDAKAEVRQLRAQLEPAMAACGHAILTGLDDDAFTGRLRRCLMTLSGGDAPVGFNYACVRKPAGDYGVTLVWQVGAKTPPPGTPDVFTAHGEEETLAFLRAAEKVLKDDYYRTLLFTARRPKPAD